MNIEQRLAAAGVDAQSMTDGDAAWRSLRSKEGRRATLLDRIAIETLVRDCAVDDIPTAVRKHINAVVLAADFDGFELVGDDRNEAVEIVNYDPLWPQRFAEWRFRLGDGLGDIALRIDHVGSTAVPGLAAKPVVDIQISVRDVADETRYVPVIERLGVALRSRDDSHRYFRPAPPRPRTVQIHVCELGSTWERDHVLFRDYLRASRTVANAYGDLKRQLAKTHRTDRLAYTAGKTGMILDTLEAAEAWANTCGWSVDDSNGNAG